MAKLATIAEAYGIDSQECVHRLIDGFYSSPHTETGKDVQKIMATGARAQAQASSNPLMQIWNTLPEEAQGELIQKAIGSFLGQKGGSGGPF